MLDDKDDLSWLARKAGAAAGMKGTRRPAIPESPEAKALLGELRAGGIKGSIEDRTLFTRSLPPGCRGCLGGKGTNLYVTGLCTRECYFCFNEQPRKDETVVHGIKIKEPEEARAIVKRFRLRSVGMSGGEPLMFPERAVRIIRAIKALPGVRVDLYSNGDRADEAKLKALKEAGLDSMRFNLVANGFNYAPVELALRFFEGTAVEIPVVPEKMNELEAMVRRLDELGVPYLNIHELFSCGENKRKVGGKGHEEADRQSSMLFWRPVDGGEEAALKLLLYSLRNTKKLSTYYCSCRTQEMISEHGLRRRKRLRIKEPAA